MLKRHIVLATLVATLAVVTGCDKKETPKESVTPAKATSTTTTTTVTASSAPAAASNVATTSASSVVAVTKTSTTTTTTVDKTANIPEKQKY